MLDQDWWTGGLVDWWIGGLVDWWTDGLVDWWTGSPMDWWIDGSPLHPLTLDGPGAAGGSNH